MSAVSLARVPFWDSSIDVERKELATRKEASLKGKNSVTEKDAQPKCFIVILLSLSALSLQYISIDEQRSGGANQLYFCETTSLVLPTFVQIGLVMPAVIPDPLRGSM
jgi:hypothetical protein